MKIIRWFLSILLVIFVFLKLSAGLYIDYTWFKDLGYTQLFTTPLLVKIAVAVISFLAYFIILSIMSIVALRVYRSAELEEVRFRNPFKIHLVTDEFEEKPSILTEKTFKYILITGAVILSFLFASSATSGLWLKFLQYVNLTDFGIKENVFGKDISFYIFKMPLLSFVLSSLTSSLAIILLISFIAFPLTGLIHVGGSIFKKGTLVIPSSIRRFWSVLIALFFLLLALNKFFSMYEIMYSQTGYVYGAGYTDIYVTVPLAYIMSTIAILGSIVSLVYFFVNDHRLIVSSFALFIAAAILGSVAQGLVQYNVSNNEFLKEEPYIAEEMKFTRLAYNLNNIKVEDYPGNTPISVMDVYSNLDTIENIRLNDPKPLQTVLSQNQGLRYYYRFNDIDIDRYKINNSYRQVLLSGRELSEQALTEKASTFVNMTMRYTHGYGVAATLANEIDDTGYAKLIVKDIPPQASVKDIVIKEPRIYFGELTDDNTYGYVIGNTQAKEFDYPKGEENAENLYQGKTGLQLTGLNKLFLSAYFNTLRFYLASEITNNSKLLMKRNIVERVNTLMPYLAYDGDPYLVIAKNGKLYWMLDAYSFSDKFPYSAPYGNVNYIRNSVKVVVDPYNGTVDFYNFDKKDPILKTLTKIFPGVFKDPSQMPSNLLEHIRYPEDYFKIQSNVLLNFHVNNISVFYNKEDTWDVAKRIEEGNTSNIEPYYTVMKLPGETKTEFTLMLPFTPASRQEQHRNNLVAWLAARNDSGNYGQLVLYKMPKNVEIQGPLMIDSMIDQDTVISGKMTLWGQGGSDVIRGNLMVVPINGGFVYVEPIYIRADKQGASIPQMQAIVFAIDKKITMVETKSLNTAINAFFGGQPLTETKPTPTQQQVPPKESILKKIEELKKQLQDLENVVQSL